MTRVAILTSVERGFASLCVPELAARGVHIGAIVVAAGGAPSRTARLRQILRKARRIGPLGALNGLRMRRWYGRDVEALLAIEPIEQVAARHGVPLRRTASVNGADTEAALGAADADLGLSLGNAWIAPRIFTIPRDGMLNVHHELLPEFQGAQSVLWSIHEGKRTTGYTIHRVERAIDGGAIVARVERPILFRDSLAATVAATYADLLADSAARLAEIVADWPRGAATATPQGEGRRFTTPTWREYRRIVSRWRELAARNGRTEGVA